MNKIQRAAILVVMAVMLIQPFMLSAEPDTDEQADFFSFKKYKYTYQYFYDFQQADLSDAGAQMRIIKNIARYFVKGFDELMQKKPSTAIALFKQSSRLVPEYFHADFIIALAYEEKDDFQNAARYYKAYLEKLKKFHEGLYRITAPLIEKTVGFPIIDYDEASWLINDRMAFYGVEMSKVSPARETPALVPVMLAVMAIGILYLLTKTAPFKRLIYKSKAMYSSRGGIWICTYCGTENADINAICHGCKRPNKNG